MFSSRFLRGTLLSTLLLSSSGFTGSTHQDAAAQREDLSAFERDFFLVDQAFSPAARTEGRKRLAELTAKAGAISETRFVLALAQIVALADNGHTMMLSRGNAPDLGRVGIRLAPFGQDFYVLRATADHADLLGARLIAIDNLPVAQLRDSAHTLTGGISSWRDRQAPQLLESPGQLHAMGMVRSAAQATYRFLMPDGRTREAELAPVPDPAAMGGHQAAGVMNPAADGAGWRTALAVEKAPWALRDFNETMRRRDAPELDAVVIQLRANVDGAQPIAAFLNESERAGRASNRKNIVLDMRMNGGGNLQLTREWMSSVSARLPADGRIFVLTSPATFSAAISSIGYLKQAGGARVVLVGEAPGDRLRFFAEGQPIRLPRSGAMILPATQRHDYLTGCVGFSDCHGPVVRFPISVKSLDPEVVAPWTYMAYVAGRDPGMEAIARRLTK